MNGDLTVTLPPGTSSVPDFLVKPKTSGTFRLTVTVTRQYRDPDTGNVTAHPGSLGREFELNILETNPNN